MIRTITVFEPRYRDRVVLLAKYRLPKDDLIQVKITKGAYKGLYEVKAEDIRAAKSETMMSKQGQPIAMKAVPLDKLVAVEWY